jgi:hypothetical protein
MIFRGDSLKAIDSAAALVRNSPLRKQSVTINVSTAPDTLSWTDNDPALRLPYGEKDFWYRIICVDDMGNASLPSAAAAGRLPDITAPGPTKLTSITGYTAYIHCEWDTNPEPDVAGYNIYRSPCDAGKPLVGPKKECYFNLIGTLTKSQAFKRVKAGGHVYYNDSSVTANSPLCYAYWVCAFDGSSNEHTGEHGCPGDDEYLCGRLVDRTPPPYPVVTNVEARGNQVKLTWKSSPVQDLKAFQVYRSEKENDAPAFIGAVLTDGTVLPDTFAGTEPSCGEIPASSAAVVSTVSFIDQNAAPQVSYWYRVSALDVRGNESYRDSLKKIPAINTFTYTKKAPPTPEIVSAISAASGCGITIRWMPEFDSTQHTGFIVFRSAASASPGRQVSQIVRGRSFMDKSALRGTKYWYSVQVIDRLGMVSKPSAVFEVLY